MHQRKENDCKENWKYMKGYGIAFKKKNYIYNNSQPTKYIYLHCIRIRPQIITETQNQSKKKKK